jgi:hypothetical protein
MTTFQEVIGTAINRVWNETEEDTDDLSPFMAAAIQAMPEMGAIKAFIIEQCQSQAVGYWDFGGRAHGVNWLKARLPESVVEWVLS